MSLFEFHKNDILKKFQKNCILIFLHKIRQNNIFSAFFSTFFIRNIAIICLTAAYIQGGLVKMMDFDGAIAEMRHFGLFLPAFFAFIIILLELGASIMILSGYFRWLGALCLGGFTLLATFIALRFWQLPMGAERFTAANAFFEHVGLSGGLLLIAWLDLTQASKD